MSNEAKDRFYFMFLSGCFHFGKCGFLEINITRHVPIGIFSNVLTDHSDGTV